MQNFSPLPVFPAFLYQYITLNAIGIAILILSPKTLVLKGWATCGHHLSSVRPSESWLEIRSLRPHSSPPESESAWSQDTRWFLGGAELAHLFILNPCSKLGWRRSPTSDREATPLSASKMAKDTGTVVQPSQAMLPGAKFSWEEIWNHVFTARFGVGIGFEFYSTTFSVKSVCMYM